MEKYPARMVIGTAGWSIPGADASRFPEDGTHLERYARVFAGVEINSSFYRPHQPQTYQRWAASTPDNFRFAVKVPKSITHERRLRDATEALDKFLDEAQNLGPKLGPLLVQLPPSLPFDSILIRQFFQLLRDRFQGEVVCEPRHLSWFAPGAEQLLTDFHVARVSADPAIAPAAAEPGGWDGLAYYRLHGSPRIYYSEYSTKYLEACVARLRESAKRRATWCIFDNTAAFAATGNALWTWEQLAI